MYDNRWQTSLRFLSLPKYFTNPKRLLTGIEKKQCISPVFQAYNNVCPNSELEQGRTKSNTLWDYVDQATYYTCAYKHPTHKHSHPHITLSPTPAFVNDTSQTCTAWCLYAERSSYSYSSHLSHNLMGDHSPLITTKQTYIHAQSSLEAVLSSGACKGECLSHETVTPCAHTHTMWRTVDARSTGMQKLAAKLATAILVSLHRFDIHNLENGPFLPLYHWLKVSFNWMSIVGGRC